MTLDRRSVCAFLSLLPFGAAAAQAATILFQPYAKPAFDAALKGKAPVLVHVHADWCPVCVRQQAVMEKLAAAGALKGVVPIKVDFDSDLEFRRAYNVGQQSVLILFRDGKEIARTGGITREDAIADFLRRAGA